MIKISLRAVCSALIAALCLPLLANIPADTVEPLTKSMKSETIAQLTKEMKEFYFFEDLAKKVEQDLNTRNTAGEYDPITAGADFAKKLTDDLNAICKDAHLRVRFSKDALPVREKQQEPSPAEIKAEKRRNLQLNGGFESVQRLPGNIGYVEVRGFIERADFEKPAQAAMAFLANTDALIIDLRRNGGGDPASVQYLCSYLFDKRTHLNDITIRGEGKTEYWTVKVPGKTFPDKPVYVLTSKRTGSGAEECAYNIQSLKRGTIIGESTWGGANPGAFVRLNDHFGAFIPNGQAMNPHTKKNWEGAGVQPDVQVASADALKVAHISAVKELLAKATDPNDKERWENTLKDLEAKP
jgi:retinol-binding protein 3